MTKKFGPTPIVIAALAGTIVAIGAWFLDDLENENYRAARKNHVVEAAATLRVRFEQSLNRTLSAIAGLNGFVQSRPDFDAQEFEAFVRGMKVSGNEIRSIELSPDAVIQFIFPLQGNEGTIGLDLRSLPDQRETVERTISDGKFVLAGPTKLFEGGTGLIGRQPIFLTAGPAASSGAREFWGFATIIIDFNTLLGSVAWGDTPEGIQFALRGKDGQGAAGLLIAGDMAVFDGEPIVTPVAFPGGEWQLAAVPKQGWNVARPAAGSFRVFAALLVGLISGGAWYLSHLFFRLKDRQQALIESERRYRTIADDLTRTVQEREQAEAEVRALNADLERRVETRSAQLAEAQRKLMRGEGLAILGELTAVVAHELRNPLGVVRNSIAIMERHAPSNEAMRRSIERIDRSATRCDNIINDLLDVTRTRNLELEKTNLSEWLRDLLDDHKLPDDVFVHRDLGDSILATFDRERLRRAVINVIDNACQAMARLEQGERTLSIVSLNAGDRVEIRVRDTGDGIANEDLEKIFDPLFTTKKTGVGLGLSIVKRLFEAHGGGVEVVSELGRGTEMCLWLPGGQIQAIPEPGQA